MATEKTINPEETIELSAPPAGGTKKKARNPKKPVQRIIAVVLRILLFPVVLLVLAVAVLTVVWLANRDDATHYIPSQTRVYAQIESISRLYEETIDNPASDTLFSALGMRSLSVQLWNWKGSISAWKNLGLGILDMKAHVMMMQDNSVLLVLEPGARGIALQLLPLAERVLQTPGFRISRQTIEGCEVYGIGGASESEDFMFLCYDKGVLMVSTTKPAMTKSIQASHDPSKRKDLAAQEQSFSTLEARQTLKVGFEVSDLMTAIAAQQPFIGMLSKELVLPESGAMGILLEPEALRIEARSSLKDPKKRVESIFAGETPLTMPQILPRSTVLYTGTRVHSLKDLYQTWMQAFPGQIPDIAGFEGYAKGIFGLGIDDLVFKWPSGEFGMAWLGDASTPVVGARIGDTAAWDRVEKALTTSIFLESTRNLVIDGVRIQRLVVPDFWKSMLKLFGISFELPWYIRYGDWLLFSSDPNALAEFGNADKKPRLTDDMSETLRSEINAANDGLLYFDLAQSQPAFLNSQAWLKPVVRQYRQGIARFSFEPGYVQARVRLEGSKAPVAALLPGYPIMLDPKPIDDPAIMDGNLLASVRGSIPVVQYQAQGSMLVRTDLGGNVLGMAALTAPGKVLPPLPDGTTAVLDGGGRLSVYDAALVPRSFNPLQTELGLGFTPVVHGDRWLVHVDDQDAIADMDTEGGLNILLKDLDPPVLRAPLVASDGYVVYTNNLDGRLYRFEAGGAERPGAFLSAGGLASGTPVAWHEQGRGAAPASTLENANIAFGRQDGTTVIFTRSETDPSKWIQIDGPSGLHAGPVLLRQGPGRIGVLFDDGTVRIYTASGQLSRERNIPALASPYDNLKSFEINGRSWILAGNGNLLWLLSDSLTVVPGFPVSGRVAAFYDLEADGKPEFISLGLDAQLAVYRLPWEAIK